MLAVDREERIITLNDAFIRMFGIHIPDYAGRNLQEIVRNKDLLQFVSKVLSASLPIEGDIVIRHERDLFLHAQGTALFNTGGKKIGAMVAVNDVTRIQRLENLRKEFVANVSHELKTPITAIKGFVETLQDGAIEHPEDAQKFLSIIVKHADRLTAIIEDLLSLSRIEQAEEKEKIDLENGAIQSVILAAMELCEPKALEKEIPFITAIDSTLTTLINTPLLEQALVNLIDNAIKYSEPKSPIRIETEKTTDSVVIHIIDQGCGIEAEHTARIFERFYRIDKARSRKQGGTGLDSLSLNTLCKRMEEKSQCKALRIKAAVSPFFCRRIINFCYTENIHKVITVGKASVPPAQIISNLCGRGRPRSFR